MSSEDVQRDLGKHEARLDHLQRDVAAMREDLHRILQMLAEVQGGKKAVGILFSTAAFIGALISALVGWYISYRQGDIP